MEFGHCHTFGEAAHWEGIAESPLPNFGNKSHSEPLTPKSSPNNSTTWLFKAQTASMLSMVALRGELPPAKQKCPFHFVDPFLSVPLRPEKQNKRKKERKHTASGPHPTPLSSCSPPHFFMPIHAFACPPPKQKQTLSSPNPPTAHQRAHSSIPKRG